MIGLIAGTVWLIGLIWFMGQVPKQSLYHVKPPTAELGIVVTGARGRIMQGLITLHERRVKKLFISGVNEKITNDQLFSSTGTPLGKTLYQNHKNKIHIGREARSTRGNALELKQYLKKDRKKKTLLLITSNYHMPRAYHEFSRALPDYDIKTEAVFSPQFPAQWWKHEQSAKLLISEYHKFVISYFAKSIAQETRLSEILANNPL